MTPEWRGQARVTLSPCSETHTHTSARSPVSFVCKLGLVKLKLSVCVIKNATNIEIQKEKNIFKWSICIKQSKMNFWLNEGAKMVHRST